MQKPGLRKHHLYSEEFKATAAKLSSLTDVLIRDVAKALDYRAMLASHPSSFQNEFIWHQFSPSRSPHPTQPATRRL
jgi:hypothetical protein